MEAVFYGHLAEQLGRSVEVAPAATVGGLRHALAARFPEASDDLLGPRIRACVGDALAGDDRLLDGVERVEFFPPLSGG